MKPVFPNYHAVSTAPAFSPHPAFPHPTKLQYSDQRTIVTRHSCRVQHNKSSNSIA